jgi:hypothetical protein
VSAIDDALHSPASPMLDWFDDAVEDEGISRLQAAPSALPGFRCAIPRGTDDRALATLRCAVRAACAEARDPGGWQAFSAQRARLKGRRKIVSASRSKQASGAR